MNLVIDLNAKSKDERQLKNEKKKNINLIRVSMTKRTTRIVQLGFPHRKHVEKKTQYLINSTSKAKIEKENRFLKMIKKEE